MVTAVGIGVKTDKMSATICIEKQQKKKWFIYTELVINKTVYWEMVAWCNLLILIVLDCNKNFVVNACRSHYSICYVANTSIMLNVIISLISLFLTYSYNANKIINS